MATTQQGPWEIYNAETCYARRSDGLVIYRARRRGSVWHVETDGIGPVSPRGFKDGAEAIRYADKLWPLGYKAVVVLIPNGETLREYTKLKTWSAA